MPQKRRKRQRTHWYWTHRCGQGTFIRAGFVHNKRKGIRDDVVRLQIKSKTDFHDLMMRPDEATDIAAGLSHVVTMIASGYLPGTALRKMLAKEKR